MNSSSKSEIVKRLNRIKGQVEGILRMVEYPKQPSDIFNQITAAKKALEGAGRFVLEDYIKESLPRVSKSKEEGNKLRDILDLIEKM